jgi:hypothetical protein
MNKGYEMLAAAVVERAIIDYKSALAEKDVVEIHQLKKFFRSGWFDFLSNLDNEVLMAQVERMVQK